MREINKRRLRAGLVGGGSGAFIGAVHRIACQLDGEAIVVAGALSSDPERARESAENWYLERSYSDYRRMAVEEAAHPEGIDFVIIATPNHLHFPVAKAFLESGFHVVCDKPMAFTLVEARELAGLVEKHNRIFAVTHNYSGYAAVRHAREIVRQGRIGDIYRVMVEFMQDWLLDPLEATGQKQAAWRTDPTKAGISCTVADIGTHGENLLEFITGYRITSLCADLAACVPGRKLDDDASMLLRMEKGARGILTCSQVSCGEENNLNIRIYGTQAGLEWRQHDPDTLIIKPKGKAWEHWRRGQGYMGEAAKAVTRTPQGHPEGYLEAFANLYRDVCSDIRRISSGQDALGGYPTAADGVRGMLFVEKAVESSRGGGIWLDL